MKRKRKCLCALLALLLLAGCAAPGRTEATQREEAENTALPEAGALISEKEPPNASSDDEAAADNEKAPAIDETTGKIRLALAGVNMRTYGWDTLAEQFNAQSTDYIVELRDYYTGDFVDDGTSAPDDMEQYRAELADAKTRLHTDLIVGKMPDMIVFDSLSPLLRGEGTAEDAARRIQSRVSLYMTEQYG